MLRRNPDARRPRTPDAARAEEVELGSGAGTRSEQERLDVAIAPVHPPVQDRRLPVATGLVVVLVALAIAKPWGERSGEGTPLGTFRPPAAVTDPDDIPPTPEPTEDPADSLAGPVCLGAGGWRVTSFETWRGRDVRVWRAIEPIGDATGPLDPSIPTVPVAGDDVGPVGWCAPSFGVERPVGPASVDAWVVIDDVAHVIELRQVLPEGGTTYLAALYVPVAACPLPDPCAPAQTRVTEQPWLTGRVVFRYADAGTRSTVWFGADVEVLERRDDGGAPTLAPRGPAASGTPGG